MFEKKQLLPKDLLDHLEKGDRRLEMLAGFKDPLVDMDRVDTWRRMANLNQMVDKIYGQNIAASGRIDSIQFVENTGGQTSWWKQRP